MQIISRQGLNSSVCSNLGSDEQIRLQLLNRRSYSNAQVNVQPVLLPKKHQARPFLEMVADNEHDMKCTENVVMDGNTGSYYG